MRVLVTGATGFVGKRQLPALVERGHDVQALVRNDTRYDILNAVEVTEDRFSKPGSFEASVDGIDAAYYPVRSICAGGDFEKWGWRAAHNFANAGSERGVDRVVCLGGERGELSKQLHSCREAERIRRRTLVSRGNG